MDVNSILKRPSQSLSSVLYKAIDSNEYIIETKLNRSQYLLEVIYENGKTEVFSDVYSCKNYPEIYKRMDTL